MKIDLCPLRSLDLKAPSQPGRKPHLAAASGLVQHNGMFYVVADDEFCLGAFSADPAEPGSLIPLFLEELPLIAERRKAAKPDFEALLKFQDGLLAIPSGSTANRVRGALWNEGAVTRIDFSKLYDRLIREIPELNIEGAVIRGDELIMCQRGNGITRQNSVITLDLKVFQDSLPVVSAKAFKSLINVDLGEIKAVPLSFTDLAVDSDGQILFLAVAEATESTYLDGEYLGAVLGGFSTQGTVAWKHELASPAKPEGLALDPDGERIYIVIDADNEDAPAILFQGLRPN